MKVLHINLIFYLINIKFLPFVPQRTWGNLPLQQHWTSVQIKLKHVKYIEAGLETLQWRGWKEKDVQSQLLWSVPGRTESNVKAVSQTLQQLLTALATLGEHQ